MNNQGLSAALKRMHQSLEAGHEDTHSERFYEVQKLEEEFKLHERMTSSGLSKRFSKCSFDNFIVETEGQKTAKTFCMKYANALVNGRSLNLVLSGYVGNGKTHLATAVIKTLLENNLSARYTTLFDALVNLKDFKNQDIVAVRKSLSSPDLLVIDEVNSNMSKLSETDKNLIFEIFNARYKEEKPSIVITNLTGVELENALGYQVLSRLFEDSKNILVFTEQDHRLKGK